LKLRFEGLENQFKREMDAPPVAKSKREKIVLTKELKGGVEKEDERAYFLNEVFGCGEVTELSGLMGSGKT
jgi:hypothetical protein